MFDEEKLIHFRIQHQQKHKVQFYYGFCSENYFSVYRLVLSALTEFYSKFHIIVTNTHENHVFLKQLI